MFFRQCVLSATSRHSFRSRRRVSTDKICEWAASNVRYGPDSTKEVGVDLAQRCQRVVVFTDPFVEKLNGMQQILESCEDNGVETFVFNKVRIEPNDVSFRTAIDYLKNQDYDGVVAFGGGSVMDTAKAANLYACLDPDDFYDYVNAPIGKGIPIPSNKPLKPLVAIPTTAGTGSETTGVAIFDDSATKSKTGLAHRSLKPTLGIVDPNHTATLPPKVACYSGLDVLCHAIESFTALPYNQRPAPKSPLFRPGKLTAQKCIVRVF